MRSDNHVSRKLIAIAPVLLVAGIAAQLILLVAAILLFIPLLIWPSIMNRPYRGITRAMGRLMARTIVGNKHRPKAGVVTTPLSFRYQTRPARCLRPGVSPCYDGSKAPNTGGTE